MPHLFHNLGRQQTLTLFSAYLLGISRRSHLAVVVCLKFPNVDLEIHQHQNIQIQTVMGGKHIHGSAKPVPIEPRTPSALAMVSHGGPRATSKEGLVTACRKGQGPTTRGGVNNMGESYRTPPPRCWTGVGLKKQAQGAV